jgi:hypothetical protein
MTKTCTQDEFHCTRPISKLAIGPELCDLCYDYAGWENQHNNDEHDAIVDPTDDMKQCPVCHPELDKRQSKGRSNTNASGPHFSHANCNHPKTKAARAQCRKLIRQINSQKISEPVVCPTCKANVAKGEKCMTRTGKIAKQSHNDRPSK